MGILGLVLAVVAIKNRCYSRSSNTSLREVLLTSHDNLPMAASDAMSPVPMHETDSSNVSTEPNSSTTDPAEADAKIASAEAKGSTTETV